MTRAGPDVPAAKLGRNEFRFQSGVIFPGFYIVILLFFCIGNTTRRLLTFAPVAGVVGARELSV
eukprot:CAMPEP_0206469336 /NCGR_PEP_ID=MMETSP0324_2-20121206/30211_1 /ASSEMBLY_ACC=CAM_ASM_000836 /TAXON_ID=2866 /ORGANISM="Crypthecodinium cohnii, Strain Seligo" /LENGTH=63 /DNA_ID=CAMNT_0053943059 /DNA_START=47 /DNA_END=235 /DNA_ORIENTATION=-